LAAILKILGEDALAAELEGWVARPIEETGLDSRKVGDLLRGKLTKKILFKKINLH
jgi:hypothetical protein